MAKSLLSVRAKKTKPRVAKSVDEQYLGTEPVWGEDVATSSELTSAYNWYNYFGDIKSAAKMLFAHYPRNKTEIKVLRKLDVKSISPILGYNARMMSRGCKLPEDFIERFNQHENIMVKTNATSTHVVGEYDLVFSILQQEIKTSFEKYGKMIFVVKFINGALEV